MLDFVAERLKDKGAADRESAQGKSILFLIQLVCFQNKQTKNKHLKSINHLIHSPSAFI